MRFKTKILYFKKLRIFGDMKNKQTKKPSRHKHGSMLQTLIHMFMVGFLSIHKYVGAIYDNLACGIMDVFVNSCKETAYGHHNVVLHKLYFVDSYCSDEM